MEETPQSRGMPTPQAPGEPASPRPPSQAAVWAVPALGPGSVLGIKDAPDDATGGTGPWGGHPPGLNFKKEVLGTQPTMTLGKRTCKDC